MQTRRREGTHEDRRTSGSSATLDSVTGMRASTNGDARGAHEMAKPTGTTHHRFKIDVQRTAASGSQAPQTPAPQLAPRLVEPENLWVNGAGKRAFDIALALFILLCAVPLLLLIAIAIKCTSKGPVLFRQERMGMGGEPFTILKFRTMRVQDGPLVTARNDSRITRVGGLLRRTKLDELPQIGNVLLGEMSFVGPRPKITEHQAAELVCRPGLTGAATLAFIEEEKMLITVPENQLETYVVDVLHRIKSDVDREYALRSTFCSDVMLLSSTVLHLFRVRRSRRVALMHDQVATHTRTQLEASTSPRNPDVESRDVRTDS